MTHELVINAPNRVRNVCCGGIGPNSCRCHTTPAKPPERDDLEGYDPTTTTNNRNELPMETPLTARERQDVMPISNSDDTDGFAPLGSSTLASGNLDHLFANGMSDDDAERENRTRVLGTDLTANDEQLQRLLFGSNFAE